MSAIPAGRYDHAERRQAQRTGRERGYDAERIVTRHEGGS